MIKTAILAVLVTCSAAAATPQRPTRPAARPSLASFYGEEYRGLPMADKGRPFDPDALTCASWFYPFGTVLQVCSGGRTVLVVVTDRGPAWRLVERGVVLDLSAHAFSLLSPDRRHPLRPGPIPVTIIVARYP